MNRQPRSAFTPEVLSTFDHTMDEVWNELIADEAVPTVTLEAGHIRTRLARKLITFASSGWSAIQIKQLLLRTVRNDRRRGSPIQS